MSHESYVRRFHGHNAHHADCTLSMFRRCLRFVVPNRSLESRHCCVTCIFGRGTGDGGCVVAIVRVKGFAPLVVCLRRKTRPGGSRSCCSTSVIEGDCSRSWARKFIDRHAPRFLLLSVPRCLLKMRTPLRSYIQQRRVSRSLRRCVQNLLLGRVHRHVNT